MVDGGSFAFKNRIIQSMFKFMLFLLYLFIWKTVVLFFPKWAEATDHILIIFILFGFFIFWEGFDKY